MLAPNINNISCQKLQWAMTLTKFYGIPPKVTQVIYTSSSTYVPNIKAIAQIIFEISCQQGFNIKNC